MLLARHFLSLSHTCSSALQISKLVLLGLSTPD